MSCLKTGRINSNRRFNAFGFKFFVQDIPSGGWERKEGYKYNLYTIDACGFYRLVYDKITLEVLKFKTIKDAQRWVRYCSLDGYSVANF